MVRGENGQGKVRHPMDKLRISILEDGTIKTDTDRVSMSNHQSAEAFLRDVAKLAGGTETRKWKAGSMHSHQHSHGEVGHKH